MFSNETIMWLINLQWTIGIILTPIALILWAILHFCQQKARNKQ